MFNKKKKNSCINSELIDIADFIVEDYRFMRSYLSVVDKLFSEEKKKYESTYLFHKNKIIEFAKRFKLKIVDFTGKNYDCGMCIVPLNSDEFGKEDNLIIKQTIEPTIITDMGDIIKTGTAILGLNSEERKISNNEDESKNNIIEHEKTDSVLKEGEK